MSPSPAFAQPTLTFNPAQYFFSEGPIGYPEEAWVHFINEGTETLSVSGLAVDSPDFELIGPTSFQLAPVTSRKVYVRCLHGTLGRPRGA